MAKHHCGYSDAHSSDPVPIIGLYIAGISLVCLLLMLSDIFFAFRRKACHIPCRLFPLNSVTLTLLAIVAKLPVDLTTNMPSGKDQLSKLTGTTLICICMGFMAPSLASCKKSESIANLASLSIFIVTVVVNMCVQMRTGVIFSFVPEHIIMMCFMFMLLFTLWLHFVEYIIDIENVSDSNVEHFEKYLPDGISLIDRVKSWYISACLNSPQLAIIRNSSVSATVGPISIMCSLVLLQAISRAVVFQTIEFCIGVSDYGWSMWIIVATQILTIIFGTLIIAFRWLAIFDYFQKTGLMHMASIALTYLGYTISARRSILKVVYVLIWSVILVFIIFINFPMFAISLIIRPRILRWFKISVPKVDILPSLLWIREYDHPERVVKVCLGDIKKWMNASGCHHMVSMLSTLDLSTTPQLLNRFQEIGKKDTRNDEYNVTCLSLVVLVKVVAASVPDSSNPIIKSMGDTLGETFEIAYYVDQKMNLRKEDFEKRNLARKFWKDEGFEKSNKFFISDRNPNDPVTYTISKVRYTYRNIKTADGIVVNDGILVPNIRPIEYESHLLSDFMKEQGYATIEELCVGVRQLFGEMLHHLLAQLPICVYKEVHDPSFEDCEERARYLTKLLCKLDPRLEDKVQWKFPEGWPGETSRIFDATATATTTHHEATNSENDISTEDEDGSAIMTIQTVVLPQVTEQQSTDEIHPADGSDNV